MNQKCHHNFETRNSIFIKHEMSLFKKSSSYITSSAFFQAFKINGWQRLSAQLSLIFFEDGNESWYFLNHPPPFRVIHRNSEFLLPLMTSPTAANSFRVECNTICGVVIYLSKWNWRLTNTAWVEKLCVSCDAALA